MVDRWTISVPDDVAEAVMEEMSYGDNRSRWVVDAIEQKLDENTTDHEDSYPNPKVDHPIEEIVAEVSESWDDTPKRLAARRAAAEAALALAVERGSLSKQEALDEVQPKNDIDGQNEETWWRKNVRPVLKEAGEHAPGRGYVVDIDGD